MDREQKTTSPGLNSNSCRPLLEQQSCGSAQIHSPTLSQKQLVIHSLSHAKDGIEDAKRNDSLQQEEAKSSQASCGLNDSKIIIDNKNRMVDQLNDADCDYVHQQGISNIVDFDAPLQKSVGHELLAQVTAQKSIHVHSPQNLNLPQQKDSKTQSSPAGADEIHTSSLTKQDALQTDSGQIYANNPEMSNERKINQFQYFTDQQQIQKEQSPAGIQEQVGSFLVSHEKALNTMLAPSDQHIGISKSDSQNLIPKELGSSSKENQSEMQDASESVNEITKSAHPALMTSNQQPNNNEGASQVIFDSQAAGPSDLLTTSKAKLQPFEKCLKRQIWDDQYGHLVKADVEEEKKKVEENMKPPRKPLSPYLFFSQERRKVIKQQKPELNAKQIMRIVSKEWQEISEERQKEMYEYLSLRDRELYDVLCKYWKQIKQQAVKQGQQLGIPYEPLEGTIAHSVSRRKQINAAAAAAAATASQPNNSSIQIAPSGMSDSELNIQASIQSNKKDSKDQNKATKIENYNNQYSQTGRKRGRPQVWNAADANTKRGKKVSPQMVHVLQSQPSTLIDKSSDSRANKRRTKQTTKINKRKSSDFIGSQDVTTHNNNNDAFDQNEKVRRLLEDNKPIQLQESIAQKPPIFNLSGLAAAPINGNIINSKYKKQSQRSQRVSADVTTNVGKRPIDQSFLMIPGEPSSRLDNQSRGVVTQSARSENKTKLKPANIAQSNMAQENRTSHSDEDEQNLHNQPPFNFNDIEANKPTIKKLNTEEKKTQKAKNTSRRIKANNQVNLAIQNQNLESNFELKQSETKKIKESIQKQRVNNSDQKQPNKLQDLFGNNDIDSISENELMNNQQNMPSQSQVEGLLQIQKRPSTHKNIESQNKIFDIDNNNTNNLVRKTQEHMGINNSEAIDQNLVHGNMHAQSNPQRVQGDVLPYQDNSQQAGMTNAQDVIYPFYNPEMIGQFFSGTNQQPSSNAHQVLPSNSHLLLPRVQSNTLNADNQQTPNFTQHNRQQTTSNMMNLSEQISFNPDILQQQSQNQLAQMVPELDMLIGADHMQLNQSKLQMAGQQSSSQMNNANMYGNYPGLSRSDSIQPPTITRHDSIQRMANLSNLQAGEQLGNNRSSNMNNHQAAFNDILNLPVPQQFYGIHNNLNNQNGILDMFSVFPQQHQDSREQNYENDEQNRDNNQM